jgi:chromosome partitioning protein
MYVIAVANQKGGVAKTTTTLSLGAALAESGKRVLLIDLDFQMNLSLALDIEPAPGNRSVARALLGNVPLLAMVRKTKTPNLEIIPGSPELSVLEQSLPGRPNHDTALRRALVLIPRAYDYVLLDCGPFSGVVVINALAAADLLLIPTQAEFFGVYALRSLLKLVNQVRETNNPTLSYRILLTLYETQNRVHRLMNEQLAANFSNGLIKTVINRDTKLRESQMAKESIITYAPASRAAAQYRSVAQEVMVFSGLTNQQDIHNEREAA